jgi:hypothetical protein
MIFIRRGLFLAATGNKISVNFYLMTFLEKQEVGTPRTGHAFESAYVAWREAAGALQK